MLQENVRILIIQQRGFGDSVIALHLINQIISSFNQIKIDIVCKPYLKELFEIFPFINSIYTVNLPITLRMRGVKFSDFSEIYKLIKFLKKIRYDFTLNLFGDVRETLFTYLLKPNFNISVIYNKKHSVYHQVRGVHLSKFLSDIIINIPISIKNVYDAYNYVGYVLGCSKSQSKINVDIKHIGSNSKVIGIHPLAGKANKLWEFNYWLDLIEKLLIFTDISEIWIFSSVVEAELIQKKLFALMNNKIKEKVKHITTNSPKLFFEYLSKINLLICLDSFASHAAYLLGVPRLIINNGNDFFIPPGSIVLGHGYECPFYPCYDKPKCKGRYTCIKSVKVSEVVDKVINFMYNE